MEEKLKKANELKNEIDNINNFINHIVRSQGFYDEDKNKENYSVQIKLSSNIWTGSDNPRYEVNLHGKEIIKEFVNAGKGILEELLKNKQDELNNIFK